MTDEFLAAWRPAERDAVAAHRADVARMLREASGLAIAGGHVPTLLNRLDLLGIGDHVRGAPRLRLVGRRHGGDRADRPLPRRPPARAALLEGVRGRASAGARAWSSSPTRAAASSLDDARRVSLLARRFAPGGVPRLRGRRPLPDRRRRRAPSPRRPAPRCRRRRRRAGGADERAGPSGRERRSGERANAPERPRADVDERAGPGGHRRADRAGVSPPARARRPGRRSTRSSTAARSRWSRAARARSSGAARPTRCTCGTGCSASPSSQPLARLDGTDLWYLTLELPPDSRVEYKLEVVRGGHGEWIQDPLNPQPRARPVRRQLGRCTATGYERARPGPRPTRTAAHRARSSAIRSDSAAFGRRGFGALPPGALPARPGSTRCSSSTTAATTCATRRCRRCSTT